MKRYFRGFILLISMVVVSGKIKAQSDSSYYKYSIKTNALQWLVNEANVAFEYRFSRGFGLETTLGIYGIVTPMDDQGYHSYQLYVPYKGFAVRFNPKFYYIPEKKINEEALYVSPMLLLKNVSVHKYRRTLDGYEPFDEDRQVAGLSLLFGMQFTIAKKLLFDMYFGPGYRYTSDHDPEHSISGNAGFKVGYAFSPKQYSLHKKSPEIPVLKHRFAIKINTLPFIINEQNLGFEYRFNERFGLETSIGTNSILKSKGRYAEYRVESYDKSYTLRVNPKVYLGKAVSKLQFYVSPMYFHKSFEDEEVQSYPNGGVYSSEYINKNINGGSILLGFQRNLSSHFLADVFIGYGRNYFKSEESGVWLGNSYAQSSFGKEDIFNLGIKLGYGFTPIN